MKINNLKSLRIETDHLNYKLKVDKEKIITEIKLLRYHFIEYALKEVVRLFKRDTKKVDS